MSIKEQLESLARELEEALVFNKPVLPVILKANERLISIHIDPYPEINPHLVRIRLVRQGTEDLMYIDSFVDPEVVMSSVFYSKKEETSFKGTVGSGLPNKDFTIIAPGAFKGKTEVPLRWGIGGEIIGSAVVDPDGSMTAVIFPEAKDAD